MIYWYFISEVLVKLYIFDAGYNRDCEGKDIVRTMNWDEVYLLIREM